MTNSIFIVPYKHINITSFDSYFVQTHKHYHIERYVKDISYHHANWQTASTTSYLEAWIGRHSLFFAAGLTALVTPLVRQQRHNNRDTLGVDHRVRQALYLRQRDK